MSHKRPRSWGNPDLRHQTQVPAPPIAQIEQQLFSLLTPESFQPLRLAQGEKKRRDRLLTLPVMMAIVVSLVYRQIPGLSEILRVLHLEGLLWVEPVSVSKQALSKRLTTLPAALFAQVFEQVMQRIQSTKTALPAPQGWELVQQNFAALWIADGSTLEALRRKLKVFQEQTTTLGGKMMMVVEAFNHQPVAIWYTEKASANDKTFCDHLLARLPVGGLLIFDLGFFDFVWSYLWVGGTNGVQIQIFATWIFYAVLNDLCSQVAVALNQPKERISVEMVFRGLYHFARALMRSESTDVVTYLVEHHQLLGLVKAERKRHRDNAARSLEIWACSG
jgi:hypothetical protein